MNLTIPDLTQNTLRATYRYLAWLYRLSGRRVPRYKCFRCRLLVQQNAQPPYHYGRRWPCPLDLHNPKQQAPKCPVYPAAVYRYFPVDKQPRMV